MRPCSALSVVTASGFPARHDGADVVAEGLFPGTFEKVFRRRVDEIDLPLSVIDHDPLAHGVEDGLEPGGALAFGAAGAGDVDRFEQRPLGGNLPVDDFEGGEAHCGRPFGNERAPGHEEVDIGGIQLEELEPHLVPRSGKCSLIFIPSALPTLASPGSGVP